MGVSRDNAYWADMTEAHVMRTYGRLPMALVRGKGAEAWDADGKRYIDFLTGLAVNTLGHCHPRVSEAIAAQASTLIHCSNLYQIDKQAELAARLTALTGLGKAFFCNSGAEANEGAIKLARKHAKAQGHAGRYTIITARQSFHGRTLATLTATGQAKYQEGYDPLPAGFAYVDYNNLQSLEDAMDDTVCAVMLEPVQGESGVHPADVAYMKGVRALCDAHGIPLILDEVQTGVGRTGKFMAYEHYGIKPDIVTLAKALAGGVPIGCLLATDAVAAAFQPGNHASTFGGNPLACAAALAVLEAIEEEGLLGKAASLGEAIKQTIAGWGAEDPVLAAAITDVRGMGLMIGFDLAEGVDGAAILAEAMGKGLLINSIAGKTIRLLPSAVMDPGLMGEGMSILRGSVAAVAAKGCANQRVV